MSRIPSSYYSLAFLVLPVLFFLSNRDLTDTYDRSINGDMKGYYAYLPAIFIYGDLQYNFLDDYERKHYPEDGSHRKDYRMGMSNGKVVNKTFPGLSLLLLPFFLIAHFLTYLTGGDADGYSLLYQYALVVAVWTYLVLGLRLAHKFLTNVGFSQKVVWLALIGVVFGTNFFYHVAFDFSVVHVFNFFLITLFLFGFQSYFRTQQLKMGVIGMLALCVLIIVRPTNLLVVALLPLAMSNPGEMKARILELFKSREDGRMRHGFWLLAVGLGIALIPVLLWLAQSGQPIVYSYGDEGFDFSNPHTWKFLVSYQKGWLLYSPFILITLACWYFWYREQKLQALTSLGFLAAMVFIYSSWWAWHFGSGFGQRVMIDYSLVYALAFCYMLKHLDRIKYILAGVVVLLFSGLSIAQSWQTYHGILPGGKVTSEIYWENFLSFRKTARFYVDESLTFKREIWTIDCENSELPYLANTWVISDQFAHSGKRSAYVGASGEFGLTVLREITPEFQEESSYIRVGFYAQEQRPTKKTKLVLSLETKAGEVVQYVNFELAPYMRGSDWEYMEFGTEIAPRTKDTLILKTYFWDPGNKDGVFIDDIKHELFKQYPGY